MKTLSFAVVSLCLAAGVAFAQTNTMYSTTLSAAMLSTDQTATVVSTANMQGPNPQAAIPAATQVYIISPGNPRGEAAMVQVVINTTTIQLRRSAGGVRSGFPSGSLVLFGPPNWFRDYDPSGGCTLANTYITPWVNTTNGLEWLCSTVTSSWVPGFQNIAGDAAQVSATVASVAALLPSGPLFEVSGTVAITSISIPLGFVGGTFCMIPTGVFTLTATNNIAAASTAIVGKTLCETWDAGQAKFAASY